MIDTVRLRIPRELCEIPRLTNETISTYGHVTYRKGNIKNLNITEINNDSVIIEGSLTKFATDNPFGNLNFEENKEAIQLLCDTFSMRPEDARVIRIDIARNIKVNYPPKYYEQTLISKRYLKREVHNSTYFGNDSTLLIFYDKVKEVKTKKKIDCKEKNILRYERRFRQVKTLTLDMILQPDYYLALVKKWQQGYEDLIKDTAILDLKDIAPKQFFKFLAAVGIRQIGIQKIFDQIRFHVKEKIIPRKTAYDYRRKISEILDLEDIWMKEDLVMELDEKILGIDLTQV